MGRREEVWDGGEPVFGDSKSSWGENRRAKMDRQKDRQTDVRKSPIPQREGSDRETGLSGQRDPQTPLNKCQQWAGVEGGIAGQTDTETPKEGGAEKGREQDGNRDRSSGRFSNEEPERLGGPGSVQMALWKPRSRLWPA